jgi:hypothetical protein
VLGLCSIKDAAIRRAKFFSGPKGGCPLKRVEGHGGYLCRVEALECADLAALARQALALEGVQDCRDVGLQVSVIPRRKIVRFAYDAPFTYGRKGARWYESHHALARLLSVALGTTLHAYVFDPEELELVTGYGNGRKVGGESLRYSDAEWDEAELDDDAFEKMKERWPLGHLAYVFGITRDEMLKLPRAQSLLLSLDGRETMEHFSRRFEELLTPFRALPLMSTGT